MDQLAIKCIEDHKNPIVKFPQPVTKLFLKSCSLEDLEHSEKSLENYRTILKHLRVDKRSGRSQAVWLPDKKLAKVNKVTKNLLNFYGFQDATGVFLYPEEVLFLLETNRAELKFEDRCLTIQDAYNLVLSSPDYYSVYKKLALQGYRVYNKVEYDRRLAKQKPKKNKDKRESNERLEGSKKPKLESSTLIDVIGSIFEDLQAKAPKIYHRNDRSLPDFYLSKNSSLNYDFRVFVRLGNDFTTDCSESEKDLFAIVSGANLGFYRFSKVVISDLS